MLDSYELLASEEMPELPAFLIRLVVEDEQRHHQVLAGIAEQLQALVGSADKESRLPSAMDGSVPPELLEQTEEFLAIEKADGRELRRLLKALRVRRDQSLWDLVLDTSEEGDLESRDADSWRKALRPLDPALMAEARLWELLVRLQLLDTRKHQLILEFIVECCKE